MKASAKDMRFHSKKLIDSVKRGEEVIITYRGKPCAKLVPLETGSEETERSAFFGMWRDDPSSENVAEYLRKIRLGRF